MRSIRGEFGKVGKSGFLSFQDIIMSVTGILIVVSLLLALEIDTAPEQAGVEGISDDSDGMMANQTDLAETLDELVKAETVLAELRASQGSEESESELAASISRLEDEVARLMPASSNAGESETVPDDLKTKGVEILRLTSEISDLQKRIAEASAVSKNDGSRLRDLEKKVKEAEAAVVAARLKGLKLTLVPEQSDTTKEPVIVDLSRTRAIVRRFDVSTPIVAGNLQQFESVIRHFKPTSQYFVIFVRPSGADRFEQIRQAIVNGKFEVGYDAIEEDTKLMFNEQD